MSRSSQTMRFQKQWYDISTVIELGALDKLDWYDVGLDALYSYHIY